MGGVDRVWVTADGRTDRGRTVSRRATKWPRRQHPHAQHDSNPALHFPLPSPHLSCACACALWCELACSGRWRRVGSAQVRSGARSFAVLFASPKPADGAEKTRHARQWRKGEQRRREAGRRVKGGKRRTKEKVYSFNFAAPFSFLFILSLPPHRRFLCDCARLRCSLQLQQSSCSLSPSRSEAVRTSAGVVTTVRSEQRVCES